MAAKPADPFYTRKPVPDELVAVPDVASYSNDQSISVRERKLSTAGPGGTDLRKFSNKLTPKTDPFYSRKPIPDALIEGSGVPGLSKEDAVIARERKLSTAGPGGTDLRRFSDKFTPKNDPFYARKPIPKPLVKDEGVPIDPMERFENRERKLSMFQLTTDPFDELSGRRSSVVNDSALGVGRRRSSAIAPDAMAAAATHHHSGFDGNRLDKIESRADEPATSTRPAGIGEPRDGLVHEVVTGAPSNSSAGTTFAASDHGHHVQPEAV